MTTCLRYYDEVADNEPCPCGCIVPDPPLVDLAARLAPFIDQNWN